MLELFYYMIWNGFHVEQKLDKVAWNLTCPPQRSQFKC